MPGSATSKKYFTASVESEESEAVIEGRKANLIVTLSESALEEFQADEDSVITIDWQLPRGEGIHEKTRQSVGKFVKIAGTSGWTDDGKNHIVPLEVIVEFQPSTGKGWRASQEVIAKLLTFYPQPKIVVLSDEDDLREGYTTDVEVSVGNLDDLTKNLPTGFDLDFDFAVQVDGENLPVVGEGDQGSESAIVQFRPQMPGTYRLTADVTAEVRKVSRAAQQDDEVESARPRRRRRNEPVA